MAPSTPPTTEELVTTAEATTEASVAAGPTQDIAGQAPSPAPKPVPKPTPAPPSRPFPVSARSPFPDRYDIEGERAALKDLIDSEDLEQATLDPRYARFVELERREDLLREARKTHQLRGGADSEFGDREAEMIRTGLGKLTDEETDSMSLHTRDASRLFIGRMPEPGTGGLPQSSGKKVGAALRAVWYLSANDNPYADFALIDATARMARQIQRMNEATEEMEGRLATLRQRGLNFSVLRADPPVTVELVFRSPYGYSVVNLISTFDYHVRVVKTLVRKDVLSDDEGHALLHTQARRCRGIFERVVRFQRYLMREELRPLSRLDWLPTADGQARKRVQAAVGIFGELPREVFNGSLKPRHSRRQIVLTEQELRMLNEVPLSGGDPELEAATELLE
jgi:integrating conjugative element protein (TIGR03761 family)